MRQEQHLPIVAFVEKLGAKPRRIASLYIGRHEGERLLYASKAQSGYSEADAREVRERLDPLIRKDTPLSVPVSKPKATWVEPVIEAAAPSPPVSARVPHARSSKGRGGVPRENILQLLPDAVVPSKAELAQGGQTRAALSRRPPAEVGPAHARDHLLPPGQTSPDPAWLCYRILARSADRFWPSFRPST